MTTASGSSAEIEAYLAAVRASLSDIAEDERADLLAEVEASLVEAAGEGDRPIASLGPPEEFAAELRASAGLGEPAEAPAAPRGRRPLRALVVGLGQSPVARSALRIARELAPAWWLVRGFLLVAAIAAVTGASWSIEHPWLPHLPSARWSVFLIVVAVVALARARAADARGAGRARRRGDRTERGRAARDRARRAPRQARAVRHGRHGGRPDVRSASPDSSTAVAVSRTSTRTRAAGTLLHDVLLYDQYGNPIKLALGPDPRRRVTRGLERRVDREHVPGPATTTRRRAVA